MKRIVIMTLAGALLAGPVPVFLAQQATAAETAPTLRSARVADIPS